MIDEASTGAPRQEPPAAGAPGGSPEKPPSRHARSFATASAPGGLTTVLPVPTPASAPGGSPRTLSASTPASAPGGSPRTPPARHGGSTHLAPMAKSRALTNAVATRMYSISTPYLLSRFAIAAVVLAVAASRLAAHGIILLCMGFLTWILYTLLRKMSERKWIDVVILWIMTLLFFGSIRWSRKVTNDVQIRLLLLAADMIELVEPYSHNLSVLLCDSTQYVSQAAAHLKRKNVSLDVPGPLLVDIEFFLFAGLYFMSMAYKKAFRNAPPGSTPASASADPARPECSICMDCEARYAMIPCGHLCMCESCAVDAALNIRDCPICRARVHKKVRIYF